MGKKRKKFIYNKISVNEINNYAYRICNETFLNFSDTFVDSLCNSLDNELKEFILENIKDDFDNFKSCLISISSYWKGNKSYEEYQSDINRFGKKSGGLDIIRSDLEKEISDVDERIHTLLMLCRKKHMQAIFYMMLDLVFGIIEDELKAEIDSCLGKCYETCLKIGHNPKAYIAPVLNNFMHFAKSLRISSTTLILSFLTDIYDIIESQYSEIESISYSMRYKEGKEEILESLYDLVGSDSSDNKVVYKFLDDYKELNSLAESNGYFYTRSNGSHGIYKNDKGDVVVIPQGRDIGKGLSMRIQKDILLNRRC